MTATPTTTPGADPLGRDDAPDQLQPVASGPGVLRRLVSRPAAVVALVIVGVLVLVAVLAPLIFADPNAIDALNKFAPPSPGHPFGTDELGRDLLSRVANAGRLSLAIGAGSTLLALVVGTIWGLASAAGKGLVDEVLMRIAEAALAIPLILFALVFVAAFGAELLPLTIVVGLLMSPLTARVARSAVLAELESEYVHGLVAVGVPWWRILLSEVVPNAAPALLAQASLNLATSLMVEASLSFVGLGVQPPAASWGTLLQQGYTKLFQSVWYPLMPAVVIVLAIAALNTIGDQLQRVLYRSSS